MSRTLTRLELERDRLLRHLNIAIDMRIGIKQPDGFLMGTNYCCLNRIPALLSHTRLSRM